MASEQRSAIVVDYDLPVRMADGVHLSADVYRPGAPGRYPAIMVRTPYGKRDVVAFDPLAYARMGYVAVIQDVRGTQASEGRFRPFRHEAEDGAASIAWVAAQEWSNGSVVMASGSYMGATQLLAATRRPPALKAIAPTFTASGAHDGWAYQGGAFQLGSNLMWWAGMALGDLLRQEALGGDVGAEREVLQGILADPWAAYGRLPLSALPRQVSHLAGYGEWLAHPEREELWQPVRLTDRYGAIDVPALHTAGWFDVFLRGALENYVGLRAGAASERARSSQRLVIVPWGHVNPGEVVGDVWFGPEAGAAMGARLRAWQQEFFQTFLDGDGDLEAPPVRIFVMGANRWRDEDDWPPARAVPTRLYLRAGGRLTRDAPRDDEAAEFVYDPADPVPTVGGNTMVAGGGLVMGPRDRRRVHGRSDVLLYLGDVLTRDTEVTGWLKATLHVASSARDTDFTVALVDVHPDGRAIGIADGILRLHHRSGVAEQRLATPGEVYAIEVDLVATSNVWKAGHRIGIEVSSSNFPRFDRNPNHGGVIADATQADFVVARQLVFHDAGRPSFITLPIIP